MSIANESASLDQTIEAQYDILVEEVTEATKPQPKVIYEIPDEQIEWEELHKTWDNRKEDDVINIILQGREGVNMGMANGLKRINNYIHGTHKGRYILIGADSGVGKTTIADFMYVYSLWKACKKAGRKLYIKYFSFEISAAEKKLKWIAQWIKHIYDVDLPTDYIAGRIAGLTVSDEHMRMVMRAYAVVEEMLRDIEIIDHMLHPTGMLNMLIEKHYEKIGKVIRDEGKEGKKGMIRGFKPNDPQALTIAITDHLALINTEKGAFTKKDIMDRWSVYSVMCRNVFGTTFIQIQQFNTSQMSAYREQKKSEAAIAPGRMDFGDSSYTFRDADLVMGLVKPVQYDLKTYHGWNLEELGQYFIALHLMKNRYGPADRMLPLFMNPVAGMFYDLPLQFMDPAIERFVIPQVQKLEEICQVYSQPETSQ
jgi:replicative DNA helicase